MHCDATVPDHGSIEPIQNMGWSRFSSWDAFVVRELAFSIVLLMTTPAMVAGQDLQQRLEPPRRDTAFAMLESVPVTQDSETTSLALADLEAIAFQNNPTLVIARARVQSARARRVQAGLYPNPVTGYHATEIGNVGTAGQQGGFVSQKIITAGKLRLDQAIVGKEIQEASTQFNAQQQRVLSDVRVRFYDTQVAQRRVELTRDLARIGDQLVEATVKLVDGKLGTDNDLLQAEIRADESHILLDNARNEQMESWRRMTAIIGTPSMPVTSLVGDLDSGLPNLDWDTCVANVLDGHPDLNAARIRVDRACLVIRRARKEPIPNIDLSVSVRHNNITGSDVANVQVGVPIPVFNDNRGNIRSAQAEWAAACNDFKRIELSLLDRLAVAYRRYESARQQLDRYHRRMVPNAERSLNLVTDGYEKGQVKYLTLLTSQQTYLHVSLSSLAAVRELRTAASVIDGQLLTSSLSDKN